MKSQILKAPPKRKLYRNYKAFDENNFNNDLKTKLDSIKILNYPKLLFDYFRKLNLKDFNDNKIFWGKIKPFFSDKGLARSNIVLKEKGEGGRGVNKRGVGDVC